MQLVAFVTWNTHQSVSEAYQPHTPLLLETEWHEQCLTESCSTHRQSVTLVVVVFITASTQQASSTRVITCCTSSQSCFDHQNHSHHSLSASVAVVAAAAAAAHTEHAELCSSHKLCHTCHSQADAATVQVASCTELLCAAAICRSCSEELHSHLLRSAPFAPETCLPQPQSVMLAEVLHSLSSWHCMLHETKQPSLESLLPEASLQLPSFTLSGILLATQKRPQ